ncbi:MAG: putative rRNA maturation factor [candidate division WWE3 bacterium GW2011_GWF1_42_14]|uniref:Endoribonuclease YbeY n=2 Tax=Katanobacteria TaxID=422282 RepID=A0A0G0YMF0_UNCKA|nr:MAG: putative rRNA maturation factor [candidate division WWE3 bacterium GW2011_GWA1_42_12]KKS34470.1 MAG: putative rRNA maturation factor [candidate division WWE3 bacterium GW2011_GWD1_42_14]KKS37947.1 MAG: putative rRNA maturation factor [candidate division WWE3 bacterium GW2011_GWF1_42_14]KKS40254.1 MAG: putative rRNA maturation factor [candidate division WWE3 bacterium GW2011_GWE1_42_16]KKS66255.1 MAG: putative rRNA maturation factor [candidate division WWE3 bacterium GW2011_GWB1_42_6]
MDDIVISVTITGDKAVQELNKEYLDRDTTTDVLSFSINEKQEDGAYYLGDVVVNKEQALRQAANYGNDVETEIAELVAHGVLHLLGVHHHDDDGHSVHGKPVKKDTEL